MTKAKSEKEVKVSKEVNKSEFDLNSLDEFKRKIFYAFKERTDNFKNRNKVIKDIKDCKVREEKIRKINAELDALISSSEKKNKEERSSEEKDAVLVPKSSKAKKIEKIISMGDFGCKKKAVAILCSEILGERISVDDKEVDNEDYEYGEYDSKADLEDHRYEMISEIKLSSTHDSLIDTPFGCVFVLKDYKMSYYDDEGLNGIFFAKPYGDEDGFIELLDAKGEKYHWDWFSFFGLRFAEDHEIFKLVKSMGKNVLNEKNSIIIV